MARFRLDGRGEMVRVLDGMEKAVVRRVLLAAVGKSARPILRAAKAKVPQDTGALRNSLGIKRYRSKRLPMAVAIIGPRVNFKATKKVAANIGDRNVKPASYAHLVEFGTAPHVIPGAFVGGKGPLTVSHPGTPARPFLRPAYEQNEANVITIMGDEIWKGIRKEALKHVR